MTPTPSALGLVFRAASRPPVAVYVRRLLSPDSGERKATYACFVNAANKEFFMFSFGRVDIRQIGVDEAYIKESL